MHQNDFGNYSGFYSTYTSMVVLFKACTGRLRAPLQSSFYWDPRYLGSVYVPSEWSKRTGLFGEMLICLEPVVSSILDFCLTF